MAFDRENFSRIGGAVQENVSQLWSYKTDDDFATITGDNYFDEMAHALKIGDTIAATVVDYIGTFDEVYRSSQSLKVTANTGSAVTVQDASFYDLVFAGQLSSSAINVNTTADTSLTWNEAGAPINWEGITHSDGDAAIQFNYPGEYAIYWAAETVLKVSVSGERIRLGWSMHHDDENDVTINEHLINQDYFRGTDQPNAGSANCVNIVLDAGDKIIFLGRQMGAEGASSDLTFLDNTPANTYVRVLKVNRNGV